MLKKILIGLAALFILSVASIYFAYVMVKQGLPEMIKIENYRPLLVSQVYDRNNKKIGEFFRERRVLVPYSEIPKNVVNAFLAAEDDQFFQHGGLNFQALFRAAIVNMRAGHKVQGGSTITQQVAKTLFLTNERSYTRKIKDILLALQMEKNLTKEEILFLYLNQIYFGESAYGIEMAAQTYFRKPVKKLTLPEAAMLAALPKAPSDFSPVRNPQRAKERQIYVLNRMAGVNYISKVEAEEAINTPIKVYLKEDYEAAAAFYLETLRLLLVKQLGEEVVLDEGVKIYTGLDIDKQNGAREAVVKGLKELDKRQGYRGALNKIDSEEDVTEYLTKYKKKLIAESNPERTILPDGNFAEIEWPQKKDSKKFFKTSIKIKQIDKMPTFMKIGSSYEAIVSSVNDELGYAEVILPDSKAIINFETMMWARKPNFDKRPEHDQITAPTQALKKGDVILVKLVSENVQWPKPKIVSKKKPPEYPDVKDHILAELDQEPIVEGALLSIDQQTQDILAMVGGYSFSRNEFNRALQAARQTGSAYKAVVYAAALEKGYNPSTSIIDAPIAYKQGGDEGQEDEKVWKPSNHEKNYNGEITMRNALVRSLNIPSVKIIEDIGVNYATEFSQRLGIFSKLNPDFTLVLGSSSVTLYEMTKVFSQFGRLGLRTRPNMVKKVIARNGKVLIEKLDLDVRFADDLKNIENNFEEKRQAHLEVLQKKITDLNLTVQSSGDASTSFENSNQRSDSNSTTIANESAFYFENPDQLIKPEVAYVVTDMLRNVVTDPHGTGGRAAALGREVAAKTGTTNGYFDAWFVGYTPNIATGVWVGFDKERTIGKGEVGGRAALPIWLDFMKIAHENLPVMSFEPPLRVKIVKIDAETGRLASSASKRIVEQAYVQGTEPTAAASRSEEATDYLKQDMDE